jgi:hypothetical protein
MPVGLLSIPIHLGSFDRFSAIAGCHVGHVADPKLTCALRTPACMPPEHATLGKVNCTIELIGGNIPDTNLGL